MAFGGNLLAAGLILHVSCFASAWMRREGDTDLRVGDKLYRRGDLPNSGNKAPEMLRPSPAP